MSATASRSAEDAACKLFLSVGDVAVLLEAAAPISFRMEGSCTFFWFFSLEADSPRDRFTMPIIPMPALLLLKLPAAPELPDEDTSVISMFDKLVPRLPPKALPCECEKEALRKNSREGKPMHAQTLRRHAGYAALLFFDSTSEMRRGTNSSPMQRLFAKAISLDANCSLLSFRLLLGPV